MYLVAVRASGSDELVLLRQFVLVSVCDLLRKFSLSPSLVSSSIVHGRLCNAALERQTPGAGLPAARADKTVP